MKVTLISLGTRGDIQPFLSLAIGLKSKGYDVILSAPENFKVLVEEYDIHFFPIGVDLEAFMQSETIREVLDGKWFRLLKIWRTHVIPMVHQTLEACWQASQHAEIIIYHPKAYAAVDVAEKTGAIPIVASPVPMFTTREFPVIIFKRHFGKWFNLASWLIFRFSRTPYTKLLNTWRKERLGLNKGPSFSPIGWTPKGQALRLCSVSPAVIPKPIDWNDNTHMTGYWFLEEKNTWQPPKELVEFIESGPTPIYIGFGSMTTKKPQELAMTVINSLISINARAIIATGWGALQLTHVPKNIFIIEQAPHEYLFKYVKGVVHHGGAGTTAAGLRGGLPTLICPCAVDQPFWGKRVHDLGCGPLPLPIKKITQESLTERLKDLLTTTHYQENATNLSKQIQREKGVDKAIDIIESAVKTHKS
ncbi:MAG: glycosyltransferase [Pseudomonadota bacterium]